MQTKYIYANIKIPIEIKEDGKIEPLREYIDIEFSKCEELPEKKKTEIHSLFIQQNLENIISQLKGTAEKGTTEKGTTEKGTTEKGTTENELQKQKQQFYVFPNEIKNEKREHKNSSFKQRSKTNHRYTMKNHI